MISLIESTATFTNPKIELEQYCIDAVSAVDIIYFAGFEFNDVKDHVVIDLGAGTGRLSIASAFFQASQIISIDLDWNALLILKKNIKNMELDHIIHPLCIDINFLEINRNILSENIGITTIMNPPFGVQKKRADRYFLKKAFRFSDVIYSIHLDTKEVNDFIKNYVNKHDWKVNYSFSFKMKLERSFPFHNKKRKEIGVKLYRILRKR